jgi:hypothetical protein
MPISCRGSPKIGFIVVFAAVPQISCQTCAQRRQLCRALSSVQAEVLASVAGSGRRPPSAERPAVFAVFDGAPSWGSQPRIGPLLARVHGQPLACRERGRRC